MSAEHQTSSIPHAMMAALTEYQCMQDLPSSFTPPRYDCTDTRPQPTTQPCITVCISSMHSSPARDLSTEVASLLCEEISAYLTAWSASPVAFTPDAHTFIIETGASITITNSLTDYLNPPRPVQSTTLKGIASDLMVQGIGKTLYSFVADDNFLLFIELSNVLYVPDCPIRLLCP